jgi:hypothetical protein
MNGVGFVRSPAFRYSERGAFQFVTGMSSPGIAAGASAPRMIPRRSLLPWKRVIRILLVLIRPIEAMSKE